MQLIILLLVFSSIASVAFAIVGKEEPKRNLLGQPFAVYEPKTPFEKKKYEMKRAIFRLFGPFTKMLNDKIGVGERAKRNLVSAGSQLSSGEFLTLKAFFSALCFIVLTLFPVGRENVVLIFLATVIGWVLPDFWIKNKMKARHREIMRDLPLIMDLLILCIDAGLDFMLAVERTIREYKKESALISEFKEVSREIRMGLTRTQALRNLSYRVNMTEMSSFGRTLIQADKLGSPIGDALRIQAEELRIRRFQRGEELALKAPIKLLVPLLFCILPVVMIIVGGPILLQFLKGGFSVGGM